MEIAWVTNYYGRNGELDKLSRDRNDLTKSKFTRSEANKAFNKILAQCKDTKLMSMRVRLIKAAQAGDWVEQRKIGAAMKDYLGEDREMGNYDR